jgi:hypothetical protein
MDITKARTSCILRKEFRYREGVMSRAEYMEYQKNHNATVEVKQIRQYDKEERERESLMRLAQTIPLGNPNYPTCQKYFERKAALEKGFFKTEYRLNMQNNLCLEITKTEFDYFNSLVVAQS